MVNRSHYDKVSDGSKVKFKYLKVVCSRPPGVRFEDK